MWFATNYEVRQSANASIQSTPTPPPPTATHSAVCGRIENSVQGLPPPYILNKPKFALVTSTEPRNQIKAPNFGINWSHSQQNVEVVNSLTGKTVNNKISRLTKQVFFNRYANLIKQLPNLSIPRSIVGDYSETKRAAGDYQMAKREMFDAFRREDLGSWLKKPLEQDNFSIAKWHDLVIDMDDFMENGMLDIEPTAMALNSNTSKRELNTKLAAVKKKVAASSRGASNLRKSKVDKSHSLKSIIMQPMHNCESAKRNNSFGYVSSK